MPVRLATALVAGALFGWAGTRMLFLGSWTLLPWAIAAIAIGYWCGKRHVMLSGTVFGFALSFAFMLFNYTGSAPVISRFPGFALLGLVGAVCATVLAFVGSSVRARFGP